MVIGTESIKYSLENLKNSKSRSFLTILSIFIGITTIFIFVSFGLGLFNYIEEFTSSSSADKLLIQPKGMAAPGLDDTFSLTEDDLEVIRKTAGIYDASGMYTKVAKVISRDELKYVFLISFDPEKPLIMDFFNVDIAEGRELMRGDTGKVVLGYNYMIDGKIFEKGLSVNDRIEIEGVNVKIIGFFESVGNPQDDSQIYIVNDYIEDLYSGNNSFGMIIASYDTEDAEDTIARVEKNLRKERDVEKGEEDFFVQSFQDLIEAYSSALNVVIGFILLIALISVLVSAVNTANTMITSVLERYKEIGILKSIGARNSEIFKIFLFESAFLGFVAGVIGVGLGYVLTYIGGAILDSLGWGFLSPYYSWGLFVGCILFAVITGAISGVAPAVNASRINAVDALRYE